MNSISTLRLSFLACLFAPLPPVEASHAPGRRSDVEPFFPPLVELLSRVEGQSLAFRYRAVEFDCESGDGSVRRVSDGVVRLHYRPDALVVDEILQTRRAGAEYVLATERVRTHYCLLSGAYVRSTRLAGGEESLVVEHWSSLPHVAYWALGVAGLPTALEGCSAPELSFGDERVQRATFRSPQGATLCVGYEVYPARLTFTRADHPDGGASDWLVLDGAIDGGPGLPQRPTTITFGRVHGERCTSHVELWSAIEGDFLAQPFEHEASARSSILDLRSGDATVSPEFTDRPLPLERLLSWSSELPPEPATEPNVYTASAPARSGGFSTSGAALYGGGALVLLIAVAGLRRSR